MTLRLLIIGNGMAATRLVEKLSESAADRYAITMIGDEPGHAYNRIQLSPVLGAEKAFSDTVLHDAQWYKARGIRVLTGETVTQVDLSARRVITTQRELTWDELVFATGSTPFIPPVPGHDLPHVHGFRRISDVQAILAGRGPVVVLGGGVLGVEAAAALRCHGDNVTLVNRGEWLMEQQLDAQAGGLLAAHLRERGIDCELSVSIRCITPDSVTLTNGRVLAAGRVAGLSCIGLASGAFYFGWVFFLQDYPRGGNPLAAALLLLLYVPAVCALGLVIGCWVRDRERALQVLKGELPFDERTMVDDGHGAPESALDAHEAELRGSDLPELPEDGRGPSPVSDTVRQPESARR